MLSLHKLFLNDGDDNSFNEVINPTAVQRRTLVAAKNAIRDHLRADIRAATVAVLGMDHMVSPRFRTQGSWSYRTCVQLAHVPPQEMDWDFGVYLPVSVWDDKAPPSAMAKLYFDFVEASLNRLCQERGWSLDRSNPNCCRVRVTHWAHIDVPLYAAPEAKFQDVVDRVVTADHAMRTAAQGAFALDESISAGELPEIFWMTMDDIHLATRDGRWTRSDPEAVAKWFDDQVLTHGEQLRRVCRYMKAWRDHHWRDGGGPSSVLIMIVVAQGFQAMPRRDDLAVERAAGSLAHALAGPVRERGIDLGSEDFNRIRMDRRAEAVQRADALARDMRTCRHYGPGLVQDVLDAMRAHFGTRVANDRNLVRPDDGGDIRRTPAIAVAPPVVGATKAG